MFCVWLVQMTTQVEYVIINMVNYFNKFSGILKQSLFIVRKKGSEKECINARSPFPENHHSHAPEGGKLCIT